MDEYSIKDIIITTRKEYLIIEKYLLQLKKLTQHTDKSAKDFYYELAKLPFVHKKPEIQCNFFPNPMTLKGLREYIYLKFFTGVTEISYRSTCYKNNNDKYIVGTHYKNHIKDQTEFKKIIDIVLNSDFANMINFNINYQNDFIKFDITTRNIGGVFNINDKNKIYYNYLSKNDSLEFNSNNINITEQVIWQILNYKIPADILSSYHVKLIENSVSELKNVEVKLDNEKSKKVKLLIKQNNDNIILN